MKSRRLRERGIGGIGHEENSGPVPRGDTASLNTQGEDLPGQDQGEMRVNSIEAAEDLAADAINLFMDVVTDPEKMKALEDDPELKEQFKQLMNTEIPAVNISKVTDKASRKRKWSKQVPELQEESLRLRQMASDKRECANCGKQLTGNRIYYCSDDCKAEFYGNHPTSVRWNDLRAKALERDHNLCVKCGRPAEEVDHIKEIWEGGPEFDLNNLQSLCHECHVLKTNENRRKREA
jgi:5-methylcytosine-specific restriction endonuclease McrA